MKNTGLELIRGLAALMVLLCHLLLLDGSREALGFLALAFNWGSTAVITFFLLSGTVIRLSYDRNPKSRKQFCIDRVIRIFPLYYIALTFGILVECFTLGPPTLKVILGNALFVDTTEEVWIKSLWTNAALWSISFEMFFYAIFALTIGSHQKLWLKLWAITSLVSAVLIEIYTPEGPGGHFLLMNAYSCVWLLGYYLIDLKKVIFPNRIMAIGWLAMLPMADRLALSTQFYSALSALLSSLMIAPLFIRLLQKETARRSLRRVSWRELIAFIGFYLLFVYLIQHSPSTRRAILIYTILPLFGLLAAFCFRNLELFQSKAVERISLLLGRLSFSIYIIHLPFNRLANELPTDSFPLKALFFLSTSILAAIFLEFYVQPIASRWLRTIFKNRKTAAPS
ncbi:acyltransferase [Telmatocola sphagniphila]|uniref:Acyltransferase n=1 Tax=Telmatocola sphagniphila TaxID=1123043 RepID=A0A8E6B2Y9_9BACT|nr:acyltransferase family protein [Telmatocola sphagniphila]QVL30464.1 acyltransferase [Telmatocola sphagniphila]